LAVLVNPRTPVESGVVLEWSCDGKSFKNNDLRIPGKG